MTMTPKERLIAVFSGKTPDKVPFAPFDELIPRANFELDFRKRGMGFITNHSAVREFTEGISKTIYMEKGGKRIDTRTPEGVLTEYWDYKKGASNDSFVQSEFWIKSVEDYKKAVSYFDSVRFCVDDSDDALMDYFMGEEGLVHVWTAEPAFMGAQYYLGLEKWVFDRVDHPEEFESLIEALDRMQSRRMAEELRCGQKLINIGNLAGNFSPEDFERHMLPYLNHYAKALREAGKWPTIHCDASNLALYKDIVRRCDAKIIEAFTPPPIGDLSVAGAREAWGEETTIWVNFPEVILLEGYEQTRRYTKELLESDPCPNKLIGLTEMGFVGTDIHRVPLLEQGFHAILDAIEESGIY